MRFPLKRIAPLLPIVACSGIWLTLASRNFSPGIYISLAAILGASLSLGVSVVSWIDEDGAKEEVDFLHCFLAGCLTLALGLYFLAISCPAGIIANFLVMVAAACWAATARKARNAWGRLHLSTPGYFALLIALAGTTLWSQENLRCLSIYPDRVVLRPWMDTFYHATQVGLFAHSAGGALLTSPMMHGAPLPSYHYAGYLLASLVAKLSGVDAVSAAAGFYAPFGTFLSALAAYAFGAYLLGPTAGAFAVIGLLLVPDPSFYRLGTPWTSYEFFQQIAAGGAYAIAAWGLAGAYLIRSCCSGNRRQWAASALLAASTVFFKVQIFLAYSYLFAFFSLIFFSRWRRAWKVLGGGVLTACYGLAAAWIRHLPRAPTLRFSSSGAADNLQRIASTFSPPNIFWWRHARVGGYLRQLVVGVPLVSLSTYGLWIWVAPALFLLAYRRRLLPARLLKLLFFFSCLIFINHLVIALGIAANAKYGDKYDVMHKTFVFPYFFIVVSASCLLSLDWAGRRRRIAVAALTSMLIFDGWAGRGLQSRLWRNCANVEIPRGLYDAAGYLRTHAAEHAVVQYSKNDERLMLACLSERTPFAAYLIVNAPPADDEFRRRFEQVDAMLSLPTFAAVRARAALLGIDWIVVEREGKASIPFTREAAPDFTSGEFQVYRLSRT